MQRFCHKITKSSSKIIANLRFIIGYTCFPFQPQLRLGSCGGFDSILSHIWFQDLSLFDGTVRQLMKSELPHIFSNTINDKGSKLNIGKDEAYQLIKRHQEAHTISADIQEIFKK